MKHTVFHYSLTSILATLFTLMFSTSVSAQYYMDIYQKGGQKLQFAVSAIDSVRFSDPSTPDPSQPTDPQSSDSLLETGLYLGVIGFNQQLYTQPVSSLDAATKSSFDSFIDNLQMKNGTLLCYSIEQAINTLKSAVLPENLSTVAMVTFTDGLDQGSLMMSYQYDTDDEYLAALKTIIRTEAIGGVPLTAYSIGLRGSDVTSSADIQKFSSTLKQLASTDANATEVTNMADVNSRFQEIAEQLNTQINLQNVAIRIPGLSNGTRVRFTFDRVSSASSSKLYIEGVFNLRSRTLTDVEYHGMTSTSGSIVTGVSDGIFVTFNFNGIQTTDNSMLSKNNIKEWYYTSSSTWQINSEFDPDQQPDIQTESSSALIMLVLDCSSSLGSQFSTAKSNAKSFINTLYSSYGNSSSGAIPGVYEYVDLGLSVKWATCNVGATKPEEYGDYFAWGETEPYYEAGYAQESPQAHWKDGKTFGYTWTNYKFRTSGNSYDNVKFSKYNTSSSYGPIDNNTTLDLEDDVAHVQWGGTWRMPTKAEQDDLRSKCTWTWYSSGNTEFNGVAGYQVTSKIEGYADRFIFLPAAGYRYDTYLYGVGSLGYYWSSSLYTDRPYSACFIGFGSEIHGTSYGSRYGGQSVRPVCP